MLNMRPNPIGIMEIRIIKDNAAPKMNSSKTWPFEISALFLIASDVMMFIVLEFSLKGKSIRVPVKVTESNCCVTSCALS